MGVIWMGGAAIRASYKRRRIDQDSDADQDCMPAKPLREVQADQSDSARHASVIGSRQTKASSSDESKKL
jgi:hypothetical protein